MKTVVVKKLLCVILFFYIATVSAQDERLVKFKAAFIYHFTKYIDWPAEKKTGDFVIMVYGDERIFKELELIASLKKLVNNQTIVIKKCTNITELGDCHILFLGADKAFDMEILNSKIKKHNILTVSDSKGSVKKGVDIEFKLHDEKLGFDLNVGLIESCGLSISHQLKQMALN